MEEKMELVTSQAEVEVVDEGAENVDIRPLIYIVRNKQVMLDSDLAFLYHVETGYLNRARKRNIKRFPEDFSFQLTQEEYEDLKCQIGISSLNEHGGRRTRPYVYTEQGVAMLSAVLKSEVAVTESIRIMKTFVRLRQYLSRDEYLLGKINELEAGQHRANIESQRFIEETNRKFDKVFDYFEQHNERTQTIFFEGQIYDSYSLLSEIVQSANSKIVVIDGYVDVITLNILSKKKKDVYVVVYTLPNSKISKLDVEKFNAQYPMIDVYRTKSFHDRFLIIDGEKGYHIGASLKDAGRKCFGINRIEDFEMIDMLLERAKNSVI